MSGLVHKDLLPKCGKTGIWALPCKTLSLTFEEIVSNTELLVVAAPGGITILGNFIPSNVRTDRAPYTVHIIR